MCDAAAWYLARTLSYASTPLEMLAAYHEWMRQVRSFARGAL